MYLSQNLQSFLCWLASSWFFYVDSLLIFSLIIVCMWNIKYSFLPWSTCHFLQEMIWKAVLKKLLRGNFFPLPEVVICFPKHNFWYAGPVSSNNASPESFNVILVNTNYDILLTGSYQDPGKSSLENMINQPMLQSSTGCRVFKKLWWYNGFASHLHPQLLMLKMLVPNFCWEHWFTGILSPILLAVQWICIND